MGFKCMKLTVFFFKIKSTVVLHTQNAMQSECALNANDVLSKATLFWQPFFEEHPVGRLQETNILEAFGHLSVSTFLCLHHY